MKNSILILIAILIAFSNLSAFEETIEWEKIGGGSNISFLNFSSDGKYISSTSAMDNYCLLRVFELESKKCVLVVNDTNLRNIFYNNFSYGTHIPELIGMERKNLELRKWDIDNNRELSPIILETNPSAIIKQCIISNDDKYIVGRDNNGVIYTWSNTDGTLIRKLDDSNTISGSYTFCISNNSKYLARLQRHKVIVTDIETGAGINEFPYEANSSYFRMFFFAGDSTFIAYNTYPGSDTIPVYNINSGERTGIYKFKYGWSGLQISRDGKSGMVSFGGDTLIMHDLWTGELIKKIHVSESPHATAYCGGKGLLAEGLNFFLIYNFTTGDYIMRLPEIITGGGVHYYNNKYLFIKTGLYERNSLTCIRTFKFQGIINDHFLRAYDEYYDYDNNNIITIRDVFTDSVKESYKCNDSLFGLSLSGNKKYAVIYNTFFTAYLMDWEKKEKIYDLDTLENDIFSPDSKYLILKYYNYKYSYRNTMVFLTETGEKVFSDSGLTDTNIFTADGKYLVLMTKDNLLKFFNLEIKNFDKVFQLEQDAAIYSLLISNDNRIIMYCDEHQGGKIIFRNIETGQIIYMIEKFLIPAGIFDLSPDYISLAVGYQDGSIIQYRLPESVLSAGNETASDNMTLILNPSPVSSNCIINYNLLNSGFVKIEIFDMFGRKVKDLANTYQIEGLYSINFNTQDLSAGIYYCSFISGNKKVSKSFVVVR